MQVLSIDLNRSPDIANAVADLQPGDEVTIHATIKAMDDQTLTVTATELSVPDPEEDGEKDESDNKDEVAVGNEGSGDVGGEADTMADMAP